MDDYTQTPEWKAWEARVHEELIPKMAGSAAALQLVPTGPTDVKFAVELGFSIMMDKPILALVQPGMEVPAKLLKVADRVIEADLDTVDGHAKVQAEIRAFLDGLPE